MPIKHLLTRGIGFSPGSIKYIITLGLSLLPITTPSWRVFKVKAEERVFKPKWQDRTFKVKSENRTFKIK